MKWDGGKSGVMYLMCGEASEEAIMNCRYVTGGGGGAKDDCRGWMDGTRMGNGVCVCVCGGCVVDGGGNGCTDARDAHCPDDDGDDAYRFDNITLSVFRWLCWFIQIVWVFFRLYICIYAGLHHGDVRECQRALILTFYLNNSLCVEMMTLSNVASVTPKPFPSVSM